MMQSQPGLCYQRAIREVLAERETVPNGAPSTLEGAYVKAIPNSVATPIILRYEWLGTMGRATASYGLYVPIQGVPTLAGVACFGWPGGVESRDICGKDRRHLAVALERGTCVPWAPKNSASFLIRHACELASKEHGWTIFYAYSDASAGEVGTVYQACNWHYLGIGVGRPAGRPRENFVRRDGREVSDRTLRHMRLTKKQAVAQGWTVVKVPAKGKYVWFEGTQKEKRILRKACRYPFQPYPKRILQALRAVRPEEGERLADLHPRPRHDRHRVEALERVDVMAVVRSRGYATGPVPHHPLQTADVRLATTERRHALGSRNDSANMLDTDHDDTMSLAGSRSEGGCHRISAGHRICPRLGGRQHRAEPCPERRRTGRRSWAPERARDGPRAERDAAGAPKAQPRDWWTGPRRGGVQPSRRGSGLWRGPPDTGLANPMRAVSQRGPCGIRAVMGGSVEQPSGKDSAGVGQR